MLDIVSAVPAQTRYCERPVIGQLPDIPLLALHKSDISMQCSRTLFHGRRVIVIGEFIPHRPGGHAESLLQDHSALEPMLQHAEGIDQIYALSRSNPVDLARYGESIGLSTAHVSYLTDPAGCFSSFLEEEGFMPMRACITDSAAYAALLNNGAFEQVYIRRPGRECTADTEE